MFLTKINCPKFTNYIGKLYVMVGGGKAGKDSIFYSRRAEVGGAPAHQAGQRWCWRVRCWMWIKQHSKGAPGEWDKQLEGETEVVEEHLAVAMVTAKGRVDLSREWGHPNWQVLRKAAMSHIPLATLLRTGQRWQQLLPHLHFRVTLASAQPLPCPGAE